MGTVESQACNSTIGRTHARVARSLNVRPGRFEACHHCGHRILTAILNRYRDPLGIASDLKGLSLDEIEILADLDHGRD